MIRPREVYKTYNSFLPSSLYDTLLALRNRRWNIEAKEMKQRIKNCCSTTPPVYTCRTVCSICVLVLTLNTAPQSWIVKDLLGLLAPNSRRDEPGTTNEMSNNPKHSPILCAQMPKSSVSGKKKCIILPSSMWSKALIHNGASRIRMNWGS